MVTIKSKFLYLVVLSCLIFQVSKFYSFYSQYSAWQYMDWVINYQGGFVRRGLIGEFLFQIHSMFNINLDFLIFVFVASLYFFITYLLIKTVKIIENSSLNTLIIWII